MRVTIIGGGIGGLAAAVALRRVGIEALVIERAPTIREVGAGLSIWSNAVNALRELGLDSAVTAAASVIERHVTRTPHGRRISETDFGPIAKVAGAPCICIHRAALQRILLEALPAGSVRTGARCTGFDDSTAILESGERIEADLLVGADGISSAIRDALHGATAPRYAGYTCWRGILRDAGALAGQPRTPLLVLGAGSQFGLWPCGAGQLYWFLTRNAPPGTRKTKADALAVCRGWAAPVPGVIDGTPEDAILQNDIIDRPPLRWWGRGHVTLLGDAAHAATPNLGQGACQALEDAVVLAQCLNGPRAALTPSEIEAALRQYERSRIPRTARIVRESWQAGKILQLDSPALEGLRDWFLGTRLGDYVGMRQFRTLLTYRLGGRRLSERPC